MRDQITLRTAAAPEAGGASQLWASVSLAEAGGSYFALSGDTLAHADDLWLSEPDTRALVHFLADLLGLEVSDPLLDEETTPVSASAFVPLPPLLAPGTRVRITGGGYISAGLAPGSTATVHGMSPRGTFVVVVPDVFPPHMAHLGAIYYRAEDLDVIA